MPHAMGQFRKQNVVGQTIELMAVTIAATPATLANLAYAQLKMP